MIELVWCKKKNISNKILWQYGYNWMDWMAVAIVILIQCETMAKKKGCFLKRTSLLY